MRTPRVLLVAACVLTTSACGDEPKSTPAEDVAADVATDSTDTASDVADVQTDVAADTQPDIVEDLLLEDVEMGMCGPIAPTHVLVVSELRFGRLEAGISPGFNIDDRVSDGADQGGCQKVDFESPDGIEGIDNQFAQLLPAIEAAGGLAFEGLIQAAINDGNILLMMEVESADDLANDECVSVVIQRGEGLPIVNRDDRIEGGQTFSRNLEIAASRTDGAAIEGGLLRIEGAEFSIPAYVFTFEFLIPVTNGVIELQIHDDGTATGVMGGGISVDALIEVVNSIDGAGGVPDAVTALAPGLADLFPDETGQCQSVSVAMEVDLVPGFFYE